MRGSLIRASLLAMIATAALAPAVASAGQIVFVRQAGGSSSETNLWVMNDDGSNQRMLLAQNQNSDGVSSLNQPNLLPTGVNLAFQGAGEAPGGGCGVNCVGAYTLVGGVITRVSAAVVPCHTYVNGFCGLSDIDNGPTLTDDGRVLYLHTGAGVGVECGYFCGIYAATGNSYIVQPVLGGSPSQWPWPTNGTEEPAETGGYAASPVADPANPELILFPGLEDIGCGAPDTCHPLVVDNSSGQSYIVSDDDARQGAYAWSPSGEYIADIEGGTEPGIWVYKKAKEPGPDQLGQAWYAMQGEQSANGLGYSMSVTNAGNIIFSSGGDIYSLPPTCWGPPPAHEATEPEKPNCTIANATKLTTGGADSDATWTESTQPIIVNAPPASAPGPATGAGPSSTPPAATLAPAVSRVSQTNSTWREGNAQATFTRKHLPPIGTSFSFHINEPASVELEFTQSAGGRKVGKSCVAQTKKNEHKHRCTHTVTAGALTFAAHAGVNTVHFDGLVSAHKKLKPGSYTLLITATASGKQSTPSTLHFTITNG